MCQTNKKPHRFKRYRWCRGLRLHKLFTWESRETGFRCFLVGLHNLHQTQCSLVVADFHHKVARHTEKTNCLVLCAGAEDGEHLKQMNRSNWALFRLFQWSFLTKMMLFIYFRVLWQFLCTYKDEGDSWWLAHGNARGRAAAARGRRCSFSLSVQWSACMCLQSPWSKHAAVSSTNQSRDIPVLLL